MDIAHFSFSDACEMAAAITDADAEYIALQSGEYRYRLSRCAIGSIHLQWALSGPHIVRAAIPRDRCALLFSLARPLASRYHGNPIGDNDVAVYAPSTECYGISEAPVAWGLISTPKDDPLAERILGLLDLAGSAGAARGPVMSLDAASMGSLRATIWLAELAAAQPSGQGKAASRAIGDAVRTALARIAPQSAGHGRHNGTIHRRQQGLIERVNQFVDAHLDTPIYTEDLCAAAQASQALLHEAFVAFFGMSPQRYLKRRRLSLVRRALLDAHDRATSVKTEALRFGFWHLGRFAADYHRCFGEHPGHTLRIRHGG